MDIFNLLSLIGIAIFRERWKLGNASFVIRLFIDLQSFPRSIWSEILGSSVSAAPLFLSRLLHNDLFPSIYLLASASRLFTA